MSQHDMDIANAGGAGIRADINLALLALASNNSGATAPTATFAYMWWPDTTTGLLKQRNAGNSAWVTIGALADLGIQSSVQILAAAAGTADAITATYVPAVPSLTNGLTLYVRAGLANATTTPTFSPNGLAAKIIVKGAGSALAAGDIAGAGHWVEVQYDATLDKWVLLNPATGVNSVPAGSITPIKLSQPFTSGTAVTTTSGTAIDFTGIPSWVKRVTLSFSGLSTNGTSAIRLQIGPVGGISASGYAGSGAAISTGSAAAVQCSTSGFDFNDANSAAASRHGSVVFSLIDAATNLWAIAGTFGLSNQALVGFIGGAKTLSGALSIIRITTVNGTDTFDSGSANILYE